MDRSCTSSAFRYTCHPGRNRPFRDRAETADLLVRAFPVEGNVGELAVAQLDAPLCEVVAESSLRFMLAPVEMAIAFGDPELMQLIAALDEPGEWNRIEQLIADDESGITLRDFPEIGVLAWRRKAVQPVNRCAVSIECWPVPQPAIRMSRPSRLAMSRWRRTIWARRPSCFHGMCT